MKEFLEELLMKSLRNSGGTLEVNVKSEVKTKSDDFWGYSRHVVFDNKILA